MKKSLLILVIFTLLLSSCSLFQKRETIPNQPEQALEKKLGVIFSSVDQNILNAPTKFLLLTSTDEKIYIDSISVNLKKFQKRNVEVEGQWNESKTIFNVDDVKIVGQSNDIKQTYENSSMGIKLDYPAVWALNDADNLMDLRIILTPYETDEDLNAVDNIVIERSENNRRLEPRVWLELDEQYRSSDPLNAGSTFQQSTVGLALLSGVKKTSVAGRKIEFYVSRDTYMYKFSFSTIGDEDTDVNQAVFYEIISGFEFIPISDQPGTSTIGTETEPTQQTPSSSARTPTSANQQTAANSGAGNANSATPQTQNATGTSASASNSQNPASQATNIRNSFVNYLSSNISSLAPEASDEDSGWMVRRVEFSYPEERPEEFNAIYVIYGDSANQRKILLSVQDRQNPESVMRIAYFKPGDSSDWQLESGTDSARAQERAVVTVSSGSSTEEVVVRSGMRLLEARTFRIKIQYPSNWYWAYSGGTYNFSDRPVTSANIQVRLLKDPDDLLAESATEDISEKPATQTTSDGEYTLCVQAESKYCLRGNSSQENTFRTMLSTIQE